jgi:hypothetical protein
MRLITDVTLISQCRLVEHPNRLWHILADSLLRISVKSEEDVRMWAEKFYAQEVVDNTIVPKRIPHGHLGLQQRHDSIYWLLKADTADDWIFIDQIRTRILVQSSHYINLVERTKRRVLLRPIVQYGVQIWPAYRAVESWRTSLSSYWTNTELSLEYSS